jgi:predicted nucleic acid-binding protein
MLFSAVLDACVLIPHPLFDVLLRTAEHSLYRPLWSRDILDEVERNVVSKLGHDPVRVARRIVLTDQAFPDARVRGYERVVESMTNDPKDRHVLAAAVVSEAQVIVTANLKDFPAFALEPFGVAADHSEVRCGIGGRVWADVATGLAFDADHDVLPSRQQKPRHVDWPRRNAASPPVANPWSLTP